MTLLFSSTVIQPVLARGSILEEKGTLVDVFKSFQDRIIPGYSELYVTPGDADIKQMQKLVSHVVISITTNNTTKLSESAQEASGIGFELVRLTNKKTGAVYYILREAAGQNRGWGLYIFRGGNASSDMVIEAPHPVYDLQTDRIGFLAFEKSRAKAILLAGAHRNANRDGSADVSHVPQSIFQVVHEAITGPSTTVIDIHGFSLANEPGYPQIILSSGDGNSSLPIRQLSSILEALNFTVGIVNGGKLRDLEAAGDIQGMQSNSIGATFIHMELESSIRNYSPEYRKVVAAISEFDSEYIENRRLEISPISNVTLNKNQINLKEPATKRFLNQMKRDLWYYITAILVMIGAITVLIFEQRKTKI